MKPHTFVYAPLSRRKFSVKGSDMPSKYLRTYFPFKNLLMDLPLNAHSPINISTALGLDICLLDTQVFKFQKENLNYIYWANQLMTFCKLQIYNFITGHLCTLLCAHSLQPNFLPSLYFRSSLSYSSRRTIIFLAVNLTFVCCFLFYMPNMRESMWSGVFTSDYFTQLEERDVAMYLFESLAPSPGSYTQ